MVGRITQHKLSGTIDLMAVNSKLRFVPSKIVLTILQFSVRLKFTPSLVLLHGNFYSCKLLLFFTRVKNISLLRGGIVWSNVNVDNGAMTMTETMANGNDNTMVAFFAVVAPHLS